MVNVNSQLGAVMVSKGQLDETKIMNGGKLNIFKCAELGVKRTTRKLKFKNKKSSVLKSKEDPAGSLKN